MSTAFLLSNIMDSINSNMAAKLGNEMVKKLTSEHDYQFAKKSAQVRKNLRALIKQKSLSEVRQLLDNTQKSLLPDTVMSEALFDAIEQQDDQICQAILESPQFSIEAFSQTNTTSVFYYPKTPINILNHALNHGSYPVLQVLLNSTYCTDQFIKAKVDMVIEDKKRNTIFFVGNVLCAAIIKQDADMVQAILTKFQGSPLDLVHDCDSEENSALMRSVTSGYDEKIQEILLSEQYCTTASFNKQNSLGENVLMAVQPLNKGSHGDTGYYFAALKRLLESGWFTIDTLSAKDNNRKTAYECILADNLEYGEYSEEFLQILIKMRLLKPFFANNASDACETIINLFNYGHTALLKQLLDGNFFLNDKLFYSPINKQTEINALMFMIDKGNSTNAGLIIEYFPPSKEQFKYVDAGGNNLIAIAAMHGDLNTLQALLASEHFSLSALTLENTKGDNPERVAFLHGKANCRAYLYLAATVGKLLQSRLTDSIEIRSLLAENKGYVNDALFTKLQSTLVSELSKVIKPYNQSKLMQEIGKINYQQLLRNQFLLAKIDKNVPRQNEDYQEYQQKKHQDRFFTDISTTHSNSTTKKSNLSNSM